MSANKKRSGQDMISVPWYNHTGASKSKGAVIRWRNGTTFGILVATTASTDTGEIEIEGGFAVTKNTGVAYTLGQRLGWDDTNGYVTTDLSKGIIGTVSKAAASGDTTVDIYLNVGNKRVYETAYVTDSTDNTNNYKDFVIPFVVGANGSGKTAVFCQIEASTGVLRAAPTITREQGSDANTIRVADASLAASETIHLRVVEIIAQA